ncbi:pyridoxamine 5'-phosphate oxidase [Aquimarina sp. MAR_2010_214]|uniref:pyridoxamine 5'-phosphate oxidase n=1 Tax=Aquimarina sp. MAR_2010_214 TaxID=1250026 RepID=UPI000C6FD7E1|nr:pyridoxamine 5'-phosphate oxidase [Aquimarina sp. MAR_2010_214]PKV48288.1 pyridoxamine 5'-phosphate oxidase [Aquimarina sp. MAR_2010_214]
MINSSEDHNPIQHFQQWFHEVDKAHPEDEANAMLLSTIGVDGFPKSRIVLLKRFTWEGFIFFTNYNSEKGKAIAQNNKISIAFNWAAAKKEVLITGTAVKIAKNLSEGYFESRPEGSKLGAWASDQSEVVASRKVLENQLQQYEIKFKNQVIPKPEHWGGYLIKPNGFEFIEHQVREGFDHITKYKLQPNYNWSLSTKITLAQI